MRKKLNVGICAYLIFILSAALIYAVMLFVNENYNKLYGNDVSFEDGVLDMSDFAANDNQPIRLAGKVEFYYNKWLVSDNLDTETPSGYLNLSDRWTVLDDEDGKSLPKTGYGSYRFLIKNNPYDFYLETYGDSYTMPWRMYADGHLACEYGAISKDESCCRASGEITYYRDYLCAANQTHEVVIEVGATDSGGRILPDRIVAFCDNTFYSRLESFHKVTDVIANMIMGLLIAGISFLLFFALISKKYKTSMSFGLIMLALILTSALSLDFFRTLTIAFPSAMWSVMEILQYVAAIGTLVCFVWHLTINKFVRFNKWELLVFAVLNALAITATILLNGYNAQLSVILVNLAIYDYIIFKLFPSKPDRLVERIAYAIMIFVLNFFYIIEALDYTSALFYNGAMIYSCGLMIIMVGIVAVYFAQINNVQKKALLAEKSEKEKTIFQAQVLRSQIKPHFIFNTLTMIIASYRNSLAEGEHALKLMAKYMRDNVDADREPLTSFENELLATDTYFELSNIRKEGKLHIFHDIDVYDFKIPYLSLQPLIENAVKYARTEDKEDGYIAIKSYEDKDFIFVEVADNGIGFDASKVRDGAVGLQNVRDRLKLLINADMTIKSALGEGTVITIKIPKENVPL